MARTTGTPTFDLKAELLARGRAFSFYQALRLLARLDGPRAAEVRVRPELSMAFPAADLAQIEALPDGAYQVTATFLSLYGTASPLPAFYTEELFQDARHESSAIRDFLDILHRRLYSLLYEGWKKYRLFVQVSDGDGSAPLRMLYALTGVTGLLAEEEEGDDFALLRYAGLLGARPRSALALQTLLTDALKGPAVEIFSCLPRAIPIPPDQRMRLGQEDLALGTNSVIGREITDIRGKFRVRIGPLSQKRFRSLLHGGPEWRRLQRLIKRFLVDPLEFDLEYILAKGETQHARLGGPEWTRLGLDTVVFSGRYAEELHAVYSA